MTISSLISNERSSKLLGSDAAPDAVDDEDLGEAGWAGSEDPDAAFEQAADWKRLARPTSLESVAENEGVITRTSLRHVWRLSRGPSRPAGPGGGIGVLDADALLGVA